MGDVSTGDNDAKGLKKYKKKYPLQLRAYANKSLTPDEFNVYTELFDTLKDSNGLRRPDELMMLDIAIFDFLRIKRLHGFIRENGMMTEFEAKNGKKITKASDASYLLNAIESQFRQNMKELLLTPKEKTKKALLMGEKDLANWFNAGGKVVNATMEDKETDEDGS